jgi:hypothetical protein
VAQKCQEKKKEEDIEMAVLIVAGQSTPGANTKTADLVSGTYQFVGRGKITLVAKGSALGINATCSVGGVSIINDQPVLYYGTAGTASAQDNIVASQVMNGGRVELYLRNTTATAGTTCDYALYFEPM